MQQPFNGMTVFENRVVGAAFGGGRREREVYQRCVELLDQCGLAAKANRPAGSLTPLERTLLQPPPALATHPPGLPLAGVAALLPSPSCPAPGGLTPNVLPVEP